jgi:hypothetical protein
MDHLSVFLVAMVALSVSVERVVELIKGLVPWLESSPSRTRPIALQLLATVVGWGTAMGLGPQHVLWFLGENPDARTRTAAAALLGLLANGGSAFWNHLLDIVSAIKKAKEQARADDLPEADSATPKDGAEEKPTPAAPAPAPVAA